MDWTARKQIDIRRFNKEPKKYHQQIRRFLFGLQKLTLQLLLQNLRHVYYEKPLFATLYLGTT